MNDVVIDPNNLKEKFKELVEKADAEGFVEYCQAIESTAIAMIKNHRITGASELMTTYEKLFYEANIGSKSAKFVLGILPLFPVNHYSTMRLLGKSDEVDDYILANKLNIAEFNCIVDSGYDDLLGWAIRHKGWVYAADFIHKVVQHVHEVCESDKPIRVFGNSLVDTLIDVDTFPQEMPGSIDDDISSLLESTADYRRSGLHIYTLASLGMSKTLMTMLENGMLSTLMYTNEEKFKNIVNCLPPDMTLAQLHAVNYHMGIPAIAERILFDERVDMTDFIAVLKKSSFGFKGSDLCLDGIKPLIKHITPDNFKQPERRKRILQLMDAVVEQGAVKYVSDDDVRGALKFHDVPQFAFRHIRRLRGSELEDAIGL
jgi:hypothetical protein